MKLPLVAALLFALAAPAAAAPQIAITFDDLPSHGPLPPGETRIGVAQKIIDALHAARAPWVYGFVNGLRTEDDPASTPVLDMWLDAGFRLGNHTYSHMNLNQHTLEEWEADVLKNRDFRLSLSPSRNMRRWLRFPYLAEGETVAKHDGARRFLQGHFFKIAGVTMSFDDYLWNAPYARCMAKGDAAAVKQMEDAWLAAAANSFDYYRGLSHQLYGRDIRYVLLMHLGAFDARMLPRLLDFYRAKGVRLISLERAARDRFYRTNTARFAPAGPVTLEQAMTARGVTSFPARQVQVMPFDTLCQ